MCRRTPDQQRRVYLYLPWMCYGILPPQGSPVHSQPLIMVASRLLVQISTRFSVLPAGLYITPLTFGLLTVLNVHHYHGSVHECFCKFKVQQYLEEWFYIIYSFFFRCGYCKPLCCNGDAGCNLGRQYSSDVATLWVLFFFFMSQIR
ncbi:hypothetical protein P175DRAFT_0228450 [Aspergillus ochraceoroseus IBT 24754]|uniref:Uncharacterized protein n=1 Tax=Aspergillus ochraceoroseus IBT 24754 TaxID=1392256 RepID=A0A2T5LWS2_9EURO|nr:uncharacterized protein P175DRAFT_0228450 [Aspergillus ochraceoroseus IBT 24754]PTU20720.1 hypothetical protein P175DRAFT_0228450 [Aspergillus ochraceoroseus IBT 24754]